MSKTDKDRPWDVRMSDMSINIHRKIWHSHYVFDREAGSWHWVECDFDARNNVINFMHNHGGKRWARTPARHCEWTIVGGMYEKTRKQDRKLMRRVERQQLRKQLDSARREGIGTDPDIYTTI